MFYVSFMSDEIGELAYFMKHKLFGIFTTVCVICALYVTNYMIYVNSESLHYAKVPKEIDVNEKYCSL